MDQALPWYSAMPAADRSWVNLVAQAGIAGFVQWYRDPDAPHAITADVFGTAPRELVRVISLPQTVDLVRTAIGVVEESVDELASAGDAVRLREGILRYSREVAFAAAEVYAQAAEARGAWDSRLEMLVLDAVLRGDRGEGVDGGRSADTVTTQGAALGWSQVREVTVVVGDTPLGDPEAAVESVKRAARHNDLEVLTGVEGPHLVAILGTVPDPLTAARAVAPHFGRGPVVVGSVVPGLGEAARSAREAYSGLRAVAAWPGAPRPVSAEDLLPERALAGDLQAQKELVAATIGALRAQDPVLLETLSAYLERAGSLEGAARELFVHPNTVRYRLRRVTELTGRVPAAARDGWALRLALSLARLDPENAASTGLWEPYKARRTILTRPRTPAAGPSRDHRRVLAVLAPGQGAQSPGFLTPWLDLPGVADRLRQLSELAGVDLLAHGTTSDADTIRDTAVAQPLLVAAGLATLPVVLPDGVCAAAGVVAGHSVGEITAAAAAGVMTDEQAMVFVRERGTAMAAAATVTATGMTAVLGGDRDEVLAAAAAAGLTPANDNGAGQIVVAGTLDQLAAFSAAPPARARLRPLQVAGAFHTEHMAPAVAVLQDLAGSMTVEDPCTGLLSNADGTRVDSGPEFLRRLVIQVSSPVRWDLAMATMAALGVTAVLEVPPAGTLTGLVRRALPDVEAVALKTPDDLAAAHDLVARHCAAHPAS